MAQIKKAIDNIYEGKDLNTLYKRYSTRYDDTARRQKAKGMLMYIPKLSKEEFRAMYAAWANQIEQDLPNKRFSSEKAKQDAVINKIISEQRHELSDKQAKAFQRFYEQSTGEHISINEIHRKAPEELRALNEKLKLDGIESGLERQKIISMAFFGS